MHGTDTTSAQGGTHPSDRRPWTVLLLLCAAQFMVVLDITGVNVALPSIGSELGFAANELQWVITAYVLLTGGLLLLGGRLSDLLGRRRVFLAGLTLFSAASLASGLAVSPAMLIASRAAQGVGAALLSPAALSILTTTYTGAQRATALSAWGALASGGAAGGLLLGGLLTSWLSWEWFFLVNVPVGIFVGTLVVRRIPRRAPAPDGGPLDLPGALSLVSGLIVLVYAISEAPNRGWGSPLTIALLAGGIALLAAFAALERRAPRPLVDPSIWRQRSLVSAAATIFGATGILVGFFFINTLYLQDALGMSALETGLAFLPLVVMIGAGAHLAPRLLAAAGARATAVGGLLVTAAGAALLAAAPDQAAYATQLLPGFVVLGAGIGTVFVTATVSGMAEVAEHQAGLASGLMTTAHEVGSALGVAVTSVVAAGAGAGIAGGHDDASLLAVLVALALAALAAIAVPALRPPSAAHASPH